MERIPGFIASAYNKAAKMAIGGYYSQVADEIVSVLKSGMLLNLGTGPGYLPIEIVKRAPTIRVTGVDLTPRLIKIARENLVKASVADRVRFEVMNALDSEYTHPQNTYSDRGGLALVVSVLNSPAERLHRQESVGTYIW